MLDVVQVLKRARMNVAGGWAEPFCKDRQGRMCFFDSEEVFTFSVAGALAAAGGSPEAWALIDRLADPLGARAEELTLRYNRTKTDVDGRVAIEAIAACSTQSWRGLDGWLERPDRSLADVVKLFDRAILKAKTEPNFTRETAPQ